MVRMFAIFRQCCRRAIDNRREIVLVAIGQAPERTSILEACLDGIDITVRCREAFRMDCQISLIDGQIALRVDDFVVDTCITHEADIFHIDGIHIRIFVGIRRRTSSLVVSIETAGLDGQVIRAIIQLIAIDNRLARHAFLFTGERCGERPVVDGRIAIGLVAAAVDVDLASEDLDGAAVFCSCVGIAARSAFIRQVIAVRGGFDVVNCLVIGFTGRCFIAARTRCGLCPAFARERAAAIVVVGYVAFVEGIRIVVDVMRFVILSSKSCFCGGRYIVIRQFFAVDFRHVVSGDIDGRLYLEDVLVVIVLTCRIRSARRTPLCVRAAVEVRAELIGIWRVGIDLPVAVCASRDGFRCRRVIMEGTVRAASVDDDSIVSCGRGNQSTIAIWIVGQCNGTIAVCIRRNKTDLIGILNAVYGDIICRFNRNQSIRGNLAIDVDMFFCTCGRNLDLLICGDLSYIDIALRRNFDIAICQIRSGIRIVIVNINGIENLDIACSRFNRDVAQTCTYAAAQLSSIGSSFCTDRNSTSAAVDRKSRVWQFCLTDKAVNRTCAVVDIVPAILIGPANSNIRLFR